MKKIILIFCGFMLISFSFAGHNQVIYDVARKCQEVQHEIGPYLIKEDFLSICQDDLLRVVKYLGSANERFLSDDEHNIEKGKYQLNLALTHLNYTTRQDQCHHAEQYRLILDDLTNMHNSL